MNLEIIAPDGGLCLQPQALSRVFLGSPLMSESLLSNLRSPSYVWVPGGGGGGTVCMRVSMPICDSLVVSVPPNSFVIFEIP